jgi:hypothetical protein
MPRLPIQIIVLEESGCVPACCGPTYVVLRCAAICCLFNSDDHWHPHAGQELLSQLLISICGGEIVVGSKCLHEAYSLVRAENLEINVSESHLRAALFKAYAQGDPRPESLLSPFSEKEGSVSARVAAQNISIVPPDPEQYTSQADLQQHWQPQSLASLKSTASAQLLKVDTKALLAAMASLDMASLAEALLEAGPKCSHDEGLLAKVLAGFPESTATEIAHVVAMLACSSGAAASLSAAEQDPTLAWDATMLGETLRQTYPNTQWQNVMVACDIETFLVPDAEGFSSILKFWSAVGDGLSFPVAAFVNHSWTNLKGQLSFLLFAIVQVSAFCSWSVHAPPCGDPYCRLATSQGTAVVPSFLMRGVC